MRSKLVELVNATKSFGDKCILNKVRFSFFGGENYLITGPSGIGKTTLLNILAGLDLLDDGCVERMDGLVIQYLFQDILLFSNLTVKENLTIKMMSDRTYQEKNFNKIIDKTLEQTGIGRNMAAKKVSLLSGGEQRRVQLAQILMFNPDILLLDEPTANLDHENKQSIIQLVNMTFPNTVKIIVSHDIDHISGEYIPLDLGNGELHYGQ